MHRMKKKVQDQYANLLIDFPWIAMMASRYSFRNVEEVREDFYLCSNTSKKFRQIDKNFLSTYASSRLLMNLFYWKFWNKDAWYKHIQWSNCHLCTKKFFLHSLGSFLLYLLKNHHFKKCELLHEKKVQNINSLACNHVTLQ